MTEQERQDLMLAYAAGVLDEPERARVHARLAAGDPGLIAALAEAEEVLARLAATAEPITPPPEIKARLLANLPEQNPRPMRIQPASNRPGRFTGWALAAAIGALTAGGLTWYIVDKAFAPRLSRAERALAVRESQIDELQEMLGSAHATVASLGTPAGGTSTFGRVIVDSKNRQMRVYIYNMAAPPPGRVYQLWFLPPKGAPVPAPTFEVDSAGRASMMVVLPEGIDAASGAAVSDEAPGGSKTAPTGQIRLVSSKPI